MESARISSDDDKYCSERRHAIFIVAVERYGRREEIYPWHLEVPIQRGQIPKFRKKDSRSFISYAFFERRTEFFIRINWI